MPSKVVITGAGGFIGGHLWEYFVRQGHDVIACVTSGPEGLPRAGGRQVQMRLPDPQFGDMLRREQPEYLVHCAGGASVGASLRAPAQDFAENVLATESVLQDVARYSSRTRTIFVSSAAVYGDPEILPTTEDASTDPISPYGFHKLMGETICRKYHRTAGVRVAILRVFSAYGPRLQKQILWDIFRQWMTQEDVTLQGTGEESRDFIHVDDLARAIDRIMSAAAFSAEVINVAEGREVTIRRLATVMLEALGGTKRVQFTNTPRLGDPKRWWADVQRLRALGVGPGRSIEQGVLSYVEWLKATRPA